MNYASFLNDYYYLEPIQIVLIEYYSLIKGTQAVKRVVPWVDVITYECNLFDAAEYDAPVTLVGSELHKLIEKIIYSLNKTERAILL